MIAPLLRIAGLVAIYMLVLTSTDPGDLLVGALVATALVLAAGWEHRRHEAGGWARWAVALVRMLGVTAWEIGVGTVRVVRFCLGGAAAPGFVEIPRGDRSRQGVALWGVLTGESPDEYPVAVDDARHVLIVHHIDASDPAAIVARHEAARDRYQREVMP
jgi:multisubunit Na+/H+ antiporter MnhE subunit